MMIMEKVELCYDKVDAAISVMKEVAEWGRKEGFRVGRNILYLLCVDFSVCHEAVTTAMLAGWINQRKMQR